MSFLKSNMNLKKDEYENDNPFGLDKASDFHLTRRNITISLISEFTKNKDAIRILDVGCGKGNITKSIGHHFPKASIDAIDISDKAIELSLREKSKIRFIQADAINFKGFGYLYDIIVLNNIYEHIENPVGILINLKQHLAVDGVLIISTPNRYYIKNVIRKLFGLKINIPKYHITEYSIGQIYDHHLYADLVVKKLVVPKFKKEQFRLKDFVILNILKPLFNSYLRLIKSQTRLDSLLFFVSGKKKE
jgi:SAM-dependent methyltransferase